MPYPNEHSCRLEDPAQYDSFARKNCAEKDKDRCIDHVYGIKDNKSEIQALRYGKDIWTEGDARAHCESRSGSFEPAKKESKAMNLNYRNQRNAEATAKYWNKPLDRPDWYKINALSDDEAEIMIYDVIGWPYNDTSELIRSLNAMKAKTITVRINSPGGDVFDGTAIFNALKNHSSKVITRIEALAASIASVIAMAGKEVQAYSNTMMMIHNSWVLAIGDANLLRETADVLDKIDGNILDIYTGQAKTGKKETKAMMDAVTWMTAKEAKEKGFIDTILESGKAAKAQFDTSIFANCPDCLMSDDDHEPTIRDLEKALRDAGLSKNSAKTILAGGWKALSAQDQEALEVAQEILKKLNRR